MFLLSKSPYDHVARETLEEAQAAIDEGYTLEGECDESYKVTKPLKELPKEPKQEAKAEPKQKAKARK
jgi:hypothetical protein